MKAKVLSIGALLAFSLIILSGCTQSIDPLLELAEVQDNQVVQAQTNPSSCLVNHRKLIGEEREVALQYALMNPQVQELKARLEKKGHRVQLGEATVFELEKDAEEGIAKIPSTKSLKRS